MGVRRDALRYAMNRRAALPFWSAMSRAAAMKAFTSG
jgi:hypothetical protein